MKSSLRMVTTAGTLVGLAGCAAATTPTVQRGPDAEVTADGLHRVDNSVMELAYVKPDLSLGGYTKLMLDQASVAYQKDPGTRRQSPGAGGGERNFALSAEQMSNLKTMFQEAVFTALTKDDGYIMVEAPGPDVLRISAYLVDLVIRVPTEPTGGTRRQRTRSYGEVTVIFELRDSESEEILARVAERRDPTRNTDESLALVSPALVRTDMQRLFEYWANQLREGLDLVREVGLP